MLKAISTITNALGALNYKGTWNASSNTPTLADGTGAKGDYYVVSTAGTQTFGGVQLFFGTGDWIAYNGTVWQRVEGGSDGNFANVTLTSTDAGATASPLLELYRDSASPAASDTLGEIEFNGEDSAGNKQAYGLIHASILSPTSTAEQGQLHFETATAGVLTEKMIIGTSNLVINEIGAVFNVRIEGDTDANLFTTDATNSRVGIGTLSPTNKLEVSGTFGVSGVSTFAAGAVGTPAITTTGDSNTGIYFPAADELATTVGGAEATRIDSSKNLLVGVTSGSNHVVYRNAAPAARIISLIGENGGSYLSVAFSTASNQGWNGANTVQEIGSNATTSRSINAAGTVNAAGLDYAEYMTKAGEFTLAKGDVVGIDSQGKLTNVFSDAISFVVKSTNPSYVGGDSWGVGFEDDKEGLEVARQLVDRIAFSGQVPVNVMGATPGQYIIPVNDNGAIKAETVSNPTFEQYQIAVGKVIAIESDGRAKIIVKVA